MASLTVTVERGDHIDQFAEIFAEEGRRYMSAAVELTTGVVQTNAPVNLGIFKGSIQNEVIGQDLTIQGSVFSQDDPIKVEVIEGGRSPGTYAPVAAITLWVMRVIRPPANMLRSVVFMVNRAIMQRGIPGKHVFQRSYEQTEGQVKQILEVDLAAAVARRL